MTTAMPAFVSKFSGRCHSLPADQFHLRCACAGRVSAPAYVLPFELCAEPMSSARPCCLCLPFPPLSACTSCSCVGQDPGPAQNQQVGRDTRAWQGKRALQAWQQWHLSPSSGNVQNAYSCHLTCLQASFDARVTAMEEAFEARVVTIRVQMQTHYEYQLSNMAHMVRQCF